MGRLEPETHIYVLSKYMGGGSLAQPLPRARAGYFTGRSATRVTLPSGVSS